MTEPVPVSNFTFHFDTHPEHYCILNTSDDSFLFDARLSPTTIYVMTVIRTLQSGKWEFSVEGLAKYTHRGKGVIYRALEQLQAFGYYVSERVRDNGRYCGMHHVFYDVAEKCTTSPLLENTDVEKPDVEKPDVEKPDVEKPHVEKRTQPNINNTLYQRKPKRERPKAPERESSLNFDLEDIFEKPPRVPEENRSG